MPRSTAPSPSAAPTSTGPAAAGRIRRFEPGDVAAAFAVRVAAWRRAYAGLIPDPYLDRLDAPGQEARWSRRLHAAPAGRHAFVAVTGGTGGTGGTGRTGGEEIVGFAVAGPDRDPGQDAGELYMVYVRPDRFRTGAGRALLGAVATALRADGFDRLGLWVLQGNARARRFYERYGLPATGESKSMDLGQPVGEVRHAGLLPLPEDAYGPWRTPGRRP